jgi:hypothetical protein
VLLPAEGCGETGGGTGTARSEHFDAGAGARAGSGGASGAGGIGFGVGGATADSGGSFTVRPIDAGICDPGALEEEYVVELPAEGVPTAPGQVCTVAVDPAESNHAARVVLTKDASGIQSAHGFVSVDPSLQGRVIGLPVLEVLDSTDPALKNAVISDVRPENGGFSFHVSWNTAPTITRDGYTRLTFRTTLVVECGADGGVTRSVHAATDVHLCASGQDVEWVSSGDRCVVCRIIAEMAPSPIVPDKKIDDLPLARVLRLRIVELARVANTVVLLAENDGGAGLDYEWHPSTGHVARLAPDVVAWTVNEGDTSPLIQAAVSGEALAAVASWSWNEAA